MGNWTRTWYLILLGFPERMGRKNGGKHIWGDTVKRMLQNKKRHKSLDSGSMKKYKERTNENQELDILDGWSDRQMMASKEGRHV